MKNIKPKNLVISICVAIVLFVGLLFVEKSLLKPNGTVEGFQSRSHPDSSPAVFPSSG